MLFQNLILGKNQAIFCQIMREKSNHTIINVTFEFCKFQTIKKDVFINLNLTDIKEVKFMNSSFQSIEEGAFNFPNSVSQINFHNVMFEMYKDKIYVFIMHHKLLECTII